MHSDHCSKGNGIRTKERSLACISIACRSSDRTDALARCRDGPATMLTTGRGSGRAEAHAAAHEEKAEMRNQGDDQRDLDPLGEMSISHRVRLADAYPADD